MRNENTPELRTARLHLRKFAESDAAAVLEWLGDVETNRYLPWFPLQTMDEARAFLNDRFLLYYHKPSAYRYAVCLQGDARPIGYVWLADDDSCDFGYALHRHYWHRGLTTEAATAVAERIRDAGYPYLTATHDVNNPRSGAVMKKLGMIYQYTYWEQWQPKNIPVAFRLYQLNFRDPGAEPYRKYWDTYPDHFVEREV